MNPNPYEIRTLPKYIAKVVHIIESANFFGIKYAQSHPRKPSYVQ